MQLGETIATYDVDRALRGESGKFEVTSPNGETYFVTCTPSHSSVRSQLAGDQTYPQAFLIQKIAEPVAPEQSVRGAVISEAGSADSQGPFLLEDREDTKTAISAQTPVAEATAIAQSQVWELDLLYMESEAGEQPTALVVMTSDGAQASGMRGPALTSVCRNYNDLDSQVRALHAQLEEIRVQAKKMFYKAHASAASA